MKTFLFLTLAFISSTAVASDLDACIEQIRDKHGMSSGRNNNGTCFLQIKGAHFKTKACPGVLVAYTVNCRMEYENQRLCCE